MDGLVRAPIPARGLRATGGVATNRAAGTMIFGILVGGALMSLFPLYYVIVTSLKSRTEFASNRFGLPQSVSLANYRDAFDELNVARSLLNSFVTTLGGVTLSLVICTLAAYTATKMTFRGRNVAFLLIVATIMIPFQTILAPLYEMMIRTGMNDSYHGLILVYCAFVLPVGTYLLAAYMKSIPSEILEAARIDGANHWVIVRRVVVPIMRPALAALAILTTVWMWNDLLLPLLIMASPEHKTIMVGVAEFQRDHDISIPLISAGLAISMAPVIAVYLVAMRYLVSGLTAGTGK